MKIYLPAYRYRHFYILSGFVTSNSTSLTIDMNLRNIEQGSISDLTAGLQRSIERSIDSSPVKELDYVVAFDMSYLVSKLCKMCAGAKRGSPSGSGVPVCGYYVERRRLNERWRNYGILILAKCDAGEGVRDIYAFVKKFSSGSDKPWIAGILYGINIGAQGRDMNMRIRIDGLGIDDSFVAVVSSVNYLSSYPRTYTDEVTFSSESSTSIGGIDMEDGTAVVELFYLGSILSVKSRSTGAFMPVVVHYDVEGSSFPRSLHPVARAYKLRRSVSADELYSYVKKALTSGMPAVKLLMQNLVAGRALSALGCRGWVTEREIVASVYGNETVITTPILGRILCIYRRLYTPRASYRGYNGLNSLLKRWLEAVKECKCKSSDFSSSQGWVDRFVNCLETSGKLSEFRQCLLQNYSGNIRRLECSLMRSNPELFTALVFVELLMLSALIIGAHGASHLMAKAAGISSRDFAEMIEIEICANDFPLVKCVWHQLEDVGDVSFDGVIKLKYDEGCKGVKVQISTYDLSGATHTKFGERLLKLVMELGGCGSARDICNYAWIEEKRRLDRAFSILVANNTLLGELDRHLGSMPQEVAPPRDLFRFMLGGIVGEVRRRLGQTAQQQRLPRKLYQYVWPRHVPSCADGCHLCVQVPRMMCVYSPLHEELRVSKSASLWLLEPLCSMVQSAAET